MAAAFTLPLHGYELPVYLVDDLGELGEAEGRWSPERRCIFADAGLPPDRLVEVLLHECLHAAADIAGIELEELHVRVFALGLHQMIGRAVEIERLGDGAAG